MEPCVKPRPSSIIFDCKNNNNWTVCWSSKRNLLYYHNKSISQSIWAKPDFLDFTDQELKVIKSYEKKSISKPEDKSERNQYIRNKKIVRGNLGKLAIQHKPPANNDCEKLNTSHERRKRNVNETSDTFKISENRPSSASDKNPKSSSIKPDVLRAKLVGIKNRLHSPIEKQNVKSVVKMKVSKSTYGNKEPSKEILDLQRDKHQDICINISSKQPNDKKSKSSCSVKKGVYKISQTLKDIPKNHISSTESHNYQFSTQHSIVEAKNEFVELDFKNHPFSRNCSKESYQVDRVSNNNNLEGSLEVQNKQNDKSCTGNVQSIFLSDLEQMDWEDCNEEITWDSKILESKATPMKQQLKDCKHVNLNSSDFKPHLIVVVDSHVLIYNIRVFQHLISAPPNEFPAAFVIPYAVLTELDTLKRPDDDTSDAAFQKRLRYTISLIQSLLLSQHPRVIGQKAFDAGENTGGFNVKDISSSVIKCCLQYQNKGHNVVLFTQSEVLKKEAEKLKISYGNKAKLLKEIKIMSIMKQQGILDEMHDVKLHRCSEEGDIVSENCSFHISQTFKHQLQEYLTDVLNRGMFEYYGAELYQKRFFLKPPWTLREVCINLSTHWFALKNAFMLPETKRCNNSVIRLLSNVNSTKWTENTVGELLDAVTHITSQLEKKFRSETRIFNEYLKEAVYIFKKEMDRYKLLISRPSDALLEEKNTSDNVDCVFYYLLSKLKEKSDQVCAYLQFEAKRNIDKNQEYVTFLQQSGKEVLLYLNCAANILKGVQGMISHQSMIVSLAEPFVLCFEEGLKSILALDTMYNPQSTIKDGITNITSKSVVDFLYQILNSGLLPNMLTEAQTIHNILNSFVNFASEATRVVP